MFKSGCVEAGEEASILASNEGGKEGRGAQGRATGMIGMSCDNLETSRDPYLTGGSKMFKA